MLKKSNQKPWLQISTLSILSLFFVLSNSIIVFSTLRGSVIVDEKNFWGHNGKLSNTNSKSTYVVCDGYIGIPLIPNSSEAIGAFANNCEVTPPPGALPIIDVPENHSPNYVGYPAYPVQAPGSERLYFVCDGYLNSTSWCSYESHKSATKLARASGSRYWEQGLNSIRGNNIGAPNFGSPQTYGRIVGNYNAAPSINSNISSNSSVSFPQGFPASTSYSNSNYGNSSGGFDINALIQNLQNGNGSIPNLINARKIRATQIERSQLPQGQIIPLKAIPLNPRAIGGVSNIPTDSQLINVNGDSQEINQVEEIVSRIKNPDDYSSDSSTNTNRSQDSGSNSNYPDHVNENYSSLQRSPSNGQSSSEKAKADQVKQELKRFINSAVKEAVDDALSNAQPDQEYSDALSKTNSNFTNNKSINKSQYDRESRSGFTNSTQSKLQSQSRSNDGIRRKQILDIEEEYQEEITYTPISKSNKSTNQTNSKVKSQSSSSNIPQDESEEEYEDEEDEETLGTEESKKDSINEISSKAPYIQKAPSTRFENSDENEEAYSDEEEGE
jgi:hypothetical protein